MGGGLAFLTKKSFNPANWSNQRQVWEARQKNETEKRRVAERQAQLHREREEEELARVAGGEVDGGRKALGFMYDAGKVPGLERKSDNETGFERVGDGEKAKAAGGAAESLFERQPGDDDAAAAFRAMLAAGPPPPAVDVDGGPSSVAAAAPPPTGEGDADDGAAAVDGGGVGGAEDDKDKNESRERDHRTNLEKAVGRGINAQSGVTLAQQFERFPMLRGAPMVLQKPEAAGCGGEGDKKSSSGGGGNDVIGLNFKPLGQVLRNVQCLKCGKWGHARGDRECELSGWDPFSSRSSAPAFCAPVPRPAAAAPAAANSAVEETNYSLVEREAGRDSDERRKRKKEERKEERRRRRKEERHGKKCRKRRKRRRRDRSPSYSSSDSYSSYSLGDVDPRDGSRRRRRDDDSDDGERHRSGGRRSSSSRHGRSSSRRHGRRGRRSRSRSRSSSE